MLDPHPGAGARIDPFTLREGEPVRRPDLVRRLGFEHVYPRAYGIEAAPFARAMVPVELVRPGDEQVVAHGTWGEERPPLPIDFLAGLPDVISVAIDRMVVARRPLPGVRELFVVNDRVTVDRETLAHLPGLVSLSLGAGWGARELDRPGAGSEVGTLDLGLLRRMPALRDLRFRAGSAESLEPLGSLTGLERLRVVGPPAAASARLLAPLRRLRWLALDYWRALGSLRGLASLERLELMGASLPDLRAFTGWPHLRSLALNGRGVRSLEGIAALEALEELFLGGIGARDLTPLTGLSRLRRLRIAGAEEVEDLAPLGRLGSLRSLVLSLGTVARTERIESIDFVAGLDQLEELEILGAVIDDGRLDPLLGLPAIRRVRLAGAFGDQLETLRRRRPDCLVEVVPVDREEVHRGKQVGPLEIRLQDDGSWAMVQDVAGLLGVDENFEAARRIRRAVDRRDPDLLGRLELDPDADFVVIRARSEADIRRVADIVWELADAGG